MKPDRAHTTRNVLRKGLASVYRTKGPKDDRRHDDHVEVKPGIKKRAVVMGITAPPLSNLYPYPYPYANMPARVRTMVVLKPEVELGMGAEDYRAFTDAIDESMQALAEFGTGKCTTRGVFHCYVLAFDGSHPVGIAMLQWNPASTMWQLACIVVDRTHRNRGVARAIVDRIKAEVSQNFHEHGDDGDPGAATATAITPVSVVVPPIPGLRDVFTRLGFEAMPDDDSCCCEMRWVWDRYHT